MVTPNLTDSNQFAQYPNQEIRIRSVLTYIRKEKKEKIIHTQREISSKKVIEKRRKLDLR